MATGMRNVIHGRDGAIQSAKIQPQRDRKVCLSRTVQNFNTVIGIDYHQQKA